MLRFFLWIWVHRLGRQLLRLAWKMGGSAKGQIWLTLQCLSPDPLIRRLIQDTCYRYKFSYPDPELLNQNVQQRTLGLCISNEFPCDSQHSVNVGSTALLTGKGWLFALVCSKDCPGVSSLAQEGRKWLAQYSIINGNILWVSLTARRNIQLPIFIFSPPVRGNVQPRTRSPGFPKRKRCQKQCTALKFRKINPSEPIGWHSPLNPVWCIQTERSLFIHLVWVHLEK